MSARLSPSRYIFMFEPHYGLGARRAASQKSAQCGAALSPLPLRDDRPIVKGFRGINGYPPQAVPSIYSTSPSGRPPHSTGDELRADGGDRSNRGCPNGTKTEVGSESWAPVRLVYRLNNYLTKCLMYAC